MPKLVVLTKGKPHEIEMGQELTIGRGYSNLLRLEGDEISRVHAIIYRRNNEFIVRDLDSKNGVFLNGTKVAYAQLGPGDKLQVGKYKMVFDPPVGKDSKNGFVGGAHDAEVHVSNSSPAQDPGEYTSSGHVLDIPAPPPPPPIPSAKAVEHRAKPTASEGWSREEVIVLTREQWQNPEFSKDAQARSYVAQLRDAFFQSISFSATPGTAPFAQLFLEALVQAISADRGAVIVRDRKTGELSSAAMVADLGDVAVNRVVLRSGLEEGKAILCQCTEESGMFRENDTIVRDKITSLIAVPLGEALPFGLLYVDRIGDNDEFAPEDLQGVISIARLLDLHLMELLSQTSLKDAAQ